MLTMVELFAQFGVASPMPDQSAQRVVNTLLMRFILLLSFAPNP